MSSSSLFIFSIIFFILFVALSCLEGESMHDKSDSLESPSSSSPSITEESAPESDASIKLSGAPSKRSGPPLVSGVPPASISGTASSSNEPDAQKEQERFKACHSKCTSKAIHCYSAAGVSIVGPVNPKNMNKEAMEKCKKEYSQCSAACTDRVLSGETGEDEDTKGSSSHQKTEL